MIAYFYNLKVSSKLLISFSLMALISLLVGVVGIINLQRLQQMDDDLYTNQTLPLMELRIINGLFEQNRAYMRDIIIEDNPAKIESYIKAMNENQNKTMQSLVVFSKSLFTEEEKKQYIYLANVIENFSYHREQIEELCRTGNKKYAQTVLTQDGPKLSANFNSALEKLSEIKAQTGQRTAEANRKRALTAIWVTGAFVLLGGLLACLLGILIAKTISKPLTSVAVAAHKIARGDLTCEIPQAYIGSSDEVGQLGSAFSTMTANLRELIQQVRQAAEQVAAAAEELTASSQQTAEISGQIAVTLDNTAQGADTQVSLIDDTITAMQQMSDGMRQVVANSANAAGTADSAAKAAQDGGVAIQSVIAKMADIRNSVHHSSTVVTELGARSSEIGQIVDAISGIAGQTNLLALNAAIEAARAGEQGRGFAVVAEEVRKLAEQSQASAKQIAGLIAAVQRETGNAIAVMSVGNRDVEAGSEAVLSAGETFTKIAGLVDAVSDQISGIAVAVEQMSESSQQISQSVSRVDQVSRQTSADAQTVSAATQEQSSSLAEMAISCNSLAQSADKLRQLVNQFTV